MKLRYAMLPLLQHAMHLTSVFHCRKAKVDKKTEEVTQPKAELNTLGDINDLAQKEALQAEG
jgi:hypothetical protein